MQLQNIINAVVPNKELLDAQIQLVLARFQRDETADVEQIPDAPLASG